MCSVFIGGLDVHKESISAFLLNPESGEFLEDQVPNDRLHVLRAVKRWSKKGELRLCYEAGGCGFVLKRWMDQVGVSCQVIAPAFVPKGPGDRIKTDRRDARRLAQQYLAGTLREVRAPTEAEEAVRSLVRHRDNLTQDATRCKNRILKLLRLRGVTYSLGKRHWTKRHRAWLKSLTLDPLSTLVLQGHLKELEVVEALRVEADRKIEETAQTPPYREVVQRLMCLRGVGRYTAMVLVSEIGDVQRFGNPKELMSYLGLVPRQHNSGGVRRSGGITKVGNTRCRHVLGEAAWHQVKRPVEGPYLRQQRHAQPEWVVAIARKADERLHRKYWSIARRKDSCTAAIATAREMVGFVWAVMRQGAA